MTGPEGYRLSPQQRRLWRLSRRVPGPYRAVQLVRVTGDVDPQRLGDVLRGVAERHEILRTVFEHPPGLKLPLQVVRQRPGPDPLVLGDRRVELPAVVDGEPDLEDLLFDDRDGDACFRAGLFRQADGALSLALTLPALCADTSSLELLVAEIARGWAADAGADDAYQYADLAEWQNGLLESEGAVEGAEFWRSRELPGLAARLAAGRRRREGAFRPRILSRFLDRERVEALTDALQVADRPALLTIWMALLRGRCDSAGVSVAVGHDGRRYEELQQAHGPFARSLPLGLEIRADEGLRALAGRVEEALGEMAAWQELYEGQSRALEEAGPDAPVHAFRIDPALAEHGASGVALRTTHRLVLDEAFELRLRCRPEADGYAVQLDYDAASVEPGAAEDVLDGWLAAVAGATEDARVAGLPLMGEAERRRLMVEYNDTGRADVPERCVHEIIEDTAAAGPEAPALVQGAERVSYGELVGRAAGIAALLREHGVGPEDRVGVCGTRGPRLIECILGTLRAGAAYVPLDPDYPAERLEHTLRDSGATTVLLADGAEESLPAVAGVERIDPRHATTGADAGAPGASPDNLAYVIYTSGSTGLPRGVMVTHRALVNATHARGAVFPTRVSAFLLLAPVAFDSSVAGIFWTLTQGGTLVLPEPGVERNPEAIAAAIERHAVSHVTLLPSVYRMLLETAGPGQLDTLRMAYVGGEACTPDLVALHRARMADVPLFHAYGPTENTVWSTVQEVGEVDPGARVGVGRPIPNVRAYVLDEGGSPVPTGVVGEICLAGASLARGYTGMPGATAGRFAPDPYAPEPGSRLYRSGDLGRHRLDGNLEFVGRADRQVKVRGYRIEPGEIEAALAGHPGVGRAVVEALDGEDGKRLVAYVTPPRVAEDADVHRLPNGLIVQHFDRFQTDALYRHVFEEDTYFRGSVHLADGDRVLDVGANIGLFSLRAGLGARDVEVHAFEPVPAAVRRLRANRARYRIAGQVFEHALGAEEGARELTFYPHMAGMSGLHADPESDADLARRVVAAGSGEGGGDATELLADRFVAERLECRVRRLSDVMREQGWERIDLLKVDAERGELDVLRGVDDEDWGRIRQVVVEVEDRGDRLTRVRELLAAAGFEVEVARDPGLEDAGLATLHAVRERSTDVRGRPARLPALETSPAALREFLAGVLPPHMIPAVFVELDALPLLPNGKVDRAALPDPDVARTAAAGEAPAGDAERCIARIWEETLGVEGVTRDDNFFELGGDSIMAIKVVTRAREERLWLTPRDVFLHQTVRSLAAAARSGGAATAEQGRVSGPAPLTPVQRWFLDLGLSRPERFALVVEVPWPRIEGVDVWRQVVDAITAHHDALRSRFERVDGAWSARVAEEDATVPVRVMDLVEHSGEERASALREAVDAVVDGLDLGAGPLWGLVAARLAEDGSGTLVMVGHHLVTDVISWQILLEDVERAFARASRGQEVRLPAKTTSFSAWAGALEVMADEVEVRAELPFWTRQVGGETPALPRDHPDGDNTVASLQTARVELDAATTRELLTGLPRRYRVEANDVLLTALCLALREWTGRDAFVVDVEGHGRLEPSPDVDLSRTVGWFTASYPVRLDLGEVEGPGRSLMAIRGQLERVPRRGLGYGVLRHLADGDGIGSLGPGSPAEVTFNYIGQIDEEIGGEGEPFALVRDGDEPRRHVLEFDVQVLGGCLQLTLRYSAALHRPATVQAVARSFVDALRGLVEGEPSAAEFGWSPDQLEEIATAIRETREEA